MADTRGQARESHKIKQCWCTTMSNKLMQSFNFNICLIKSRRLMTHRYNKKQSRNACAGKRYRASNNQSCIKIENTAKRNDGNWSFWWKSNGICKWNIMGESNEENKNDKSCLVQTVQNIVNTVEEDLNMSQFKFDDTTEAAEWNSQVLARYNYDFSKAVENENNTILTPGAEFSKLSSIKQIWKFRNNWENIKSILKNGCIYPLKEE